MEEAFQEERFPGIHLREKLARELNIREDRIQVGLTIHLGLKGNLLIQTYHSNRYYEDLR